MTEDNILEKVINTLVSSSVFSRVITDKLNSYIEVGLMPMQVCTLFLVHGDEALKALDSYVTLFNISKDVCTDAWDKTLDTFKMFVSEYKRPYNRRAKKNKSLKNWQKTKFYER